MALTIDHRFQICFPHYVLPIPFKAHRINGFTPEFLENYYEERYGGAIRSLNQIEAQLALAREKNEINSVVLEHINQHAKLIQLIASQELFLSALGEDGGEELEDHELVTALAKEFGSSSRWKDEFRRLAISCASSGWATLAWSKRFDRLINVSSAEGAAPLFGAEPILTLDMNELVYSSDFRSDSISYINAFLENIHWTRVADDLRAVRSTTPPDHTTDDSSETISVRELHELIQHNDTPLILDVRHEDDRQRYNHRIAETPWRDSFKVEDWRSDIPKDKPIVVYCMYGFWVSQKVASQLRDKGISARSLSGGITAWRAMGLPCTENQFGSY